MFGSVIHFSNLRKLNLEGSIEIESIQGEFPRLERLIVNRCSKLKTIRLGDSSRHALIECNECKQLRNIAPLSAVSSTLRHLEDMKKTERKMCASTLDILFRVCKGEAKAGSRRANVILWSVKVRNVLDFGRFEVDSVSELNMLLAVLVWKSVALNPRGNNLGPEGMKHLAPVLYLNVSLCRLWILRSTTSVLKA